MGQDLMYDMSRGQHHLKHCQMSVEVSSSQYHLKHCQRSVDVSGDVSNTLNTVTNEQKSVPSKTLPPPLTLPGRYDAFWSSSGCAWCMCKES